MDIFSDDLNIVTKRLIYKAAELCGNLRNVYGGDYKQHYPLFALTVDDMILAFEGRLKNLDERNNKDINVIKSDLRDVLGLIIEIKVLGAIVSHKDCAGEPNFRTLLSRHECVISATVDSLQDDLFVSDKLLKYAPDISADIVCCSRPATSLPKYSLGYAPFYRMIVNVYERLEFFIMQNMNKKQ